MSVFNPFSRRHSVRLALVLALAAAATGCGVGPLRPVGLDASTGKFKAKALHASNSRFSKHHLVVRGPAAAKPPVAGARVKQQVGEFAVHELPKGMTLEQAVAAYQAAPGVTSVEKLELYPIENEGGEGKVAPPAFEIPKSATPSLAANDTRYFEQWSHAIANVPAAWTMTQGRSEVIVASLDTGCDYAHPDLQGQVINGPDFAENKDDSRDIDEHGTHVAGIIAAKAGNGLGVAGVAPGCKVLALKIFEPYMEDGKFQGTFYNAYTLARALQYAATQGEAKIVNISAGIADEEIVDTMISFARGRGLVICVSAGNKGSNTYTGAAKSIDGVIAVHATDTMDRLARFSNYGSTLGVSAPGMSILSTVPTYANPYTGVPAPLDGLKSMNGTSMASPFVAGVAALVTSALMQGVEDQIQADYGKTVQLEASQIPGTIIEDVIRLSCRDLGRPGRDEVFGAGRIDAGRAVEAAFNPDTIERATKQVLRNLKR